jgi:hypothetical protein
MPPTLGTPGLAFFGSHPDSCGIGRKRQTHTSVHACRQYKPTARCRRSEKKRARGTTHLRTATGTQDNPAWRFAAAAGAAGGGGGSGGRNNGEGRKPRSSSRGGRRVTHRVRVKELRQDLRRAHVDKADCSPFCFYFRTKKKEKHFFASSKASSTLFLNCLVQDQLERRRDVSAGEQGA